MSNNSYYQIYLKNAVPVFAYPIRCTPAEIARIFKEAKSNPETFQEKFDTVKFPPLENQPIGEIRVEQVEAYFAVPAIKQYKLNHFEEPKKFKLTELAIKRAYKDCGRRLANFRDAKTLIANVMAHENITSQEELIAVVAEETEKLSPPF